MRSVRINRILRFSFTGLLCGYIAALILSQWVWLEMRFTVALVIPVFLLIGALIGAFTSLDLELWGLFVPQGILAGCLVVLYGGNPDAISMIPAIILREGFYRPQTSVNTCNLVLVAILISGNLLWLFRKKKYGGELT